MSAPSATMTRLDDVSLDVQTEDLLRPRRRLLRTLGDLDPAGLAAAAGLHLRLDDDHRPADLRGRSCLGLGGGGRRMPRSTGTPWASKMSRAWYSYRSTLASMLGWSDRPDPWRRPLRVAASRRSEAYP